MAEEKPTWKKPKQVENQHKGVLIEIGKKLVKLREAKGLSASGLASEYHISRNAYRQMERGEIYFSTYNLLKILDFYKIDLNTFIESDIENL